MYTTEMAHDYPVGRAGKEKLQLGGLLSKVNSSGCMSKFFGNMFICVHVNSPVYYICKAVIGVNSED